MPGMEVVPDRYPAREIQTYNEFLSECKGLSEKARRFFYIKGEIVIGVGGWLAPLITDDDDVVLIAENGN